ncbi:MAG: NERD domain-containing protein [Nocardioidaceae bacterium]
MRSGASALHEAARSRLHAAEYERLALESLGWRVLTGRRWAGSKRANVDILLVGPGGVVVVDVKTWHLSTSFRTS